MEIGSEYWKYDGKLDKNNTDFWNFGRDNKFLLSGRSAIFYVLKNILEKKNVKKVYFPSYSCTSMIQAFEDLGIQIVYYDVYYNEGLKYNINLDEECDIFFAMNYFGYSESNMEKYIKYFKEKDIIIIEDITHSILSQKKFSNYSDYLIASLRKWFPISSGGLAVCVNKNFEIELPENTNIYMVNEKKLAMKNKSEYIKNINIQKDISNFGNEIQEKTKSNLKNAKQEFLNQYAESGKVLEEDYQDYCIDKESLEILMGIDLQEIINKRKENVELIYKELKEKSNIKFLFNRYNKNDCLLFVPIILENKIRNNLRRYLIDNKIYLPVHWPLNDKINNIFDNELSLICDQRYNKDEISYYLNFIKKYMINI